MDNEEIAVWREIDGEMAVEIPERKLTAAGLSAREGFDIDVRDGDIVLSRPE